MTAGVLVSALLVGGAAGVGGAAWYDAWEGGGSSTAAATTPSPSSDGGSGTSASTAVDDQGVENVAAAVLPSVVKINVVGQNEAGSGSGIILSKDGDILTNNHVVAVAGKSGLITVNFNDGRTVRASIVGTDPVTDIAVIHAKGVSGLKPATIGNSSNLKVGQKVVAVGSPYGLNATVTSGIVSALHRPVSVDTSEQQTPQNPFGNQAQSQGPDLSTTYPAIQTDAAINPGNSGGPLVDMDARVVGINSSIRTAGGAEGGSIGLGFSIPIDEVLPIIDQIRNGEKPTHARLGVTVSSVRLSALQQGAKVHAVDPRGVAAGVLKSGDVITQVDDQIIDGADSLVATIRGHRPGDSVKLTFVRGGKTQTATVKLGSDATTQAS
ncbi:MAG: S1C family serine protease [Marmoricola sp.]